MSEEKRIALYEIKVIKDFNLMILAPVWTSVADLPARACISSERSVTKKKRGREKRKPRCFLFYSDICFAIVSYLCEKFCTRMFTQAGSHHKILQEKITLYITLITANILTQRYVI